MEIKYITLKPYPLTRDTKGKPKWDAIYDDNVIVVGSTHPVRDAATKLLLDWNWKPDQLVAFRHEAEQRPSISPQRLDELALSVLKREIKRVEAKQGASQRPVRAARSPFKGFSKPTYSKDPDGDLAPLYQALSIIHSHRSAAT